MNHFKTTTVSYNYFTVYLCISVDGMLKNMGKIALFFSRKKVEICCLCYMTYNSRASDVWAEIKYSSAAEPHLHSWICECKILS